MRSHWIWDIYNISEELSNIIFDKYNVNAGEIAKGRFFGTIGENAAAEILIKNMKKIGLYTTIEQIINNKTEKTCAELTHLWEVEDFYLKINNETVPCHITPSTFGARGNPDQLEYEFHFTNLKIKPRPKRNVIINHKPTWFFLFL